MKAFIVAFALIAAVSADVSHLQGAHQQGYNYPQPQPSFHDESSNVPLPEPPKPVQQQYLPPVAHQVASVPVQQSAPVHYQPSPVVPQQQPAPVVHYQPTAPVVHDVPAPAYQPQVVQHPQVVYQPSPVIPQQVQQQYLPPVAPKAVHYQPAVPTVHDVPAPLYQPHVVHQAPVYTPAPVVHQQPALQVQQQYLPPVAQQVQSVPVQQPATVHYQPSPVVPQQQPAPAVHYKSAAPVVHDVQVPVYQPQVVHQAPVYQPQAVQQIEPVPAADFSEESGYSYKVPSA